jgi:hypothetical protein
MEADCSGGQSSPRAVAPRERKEGRKEGSRNYGEFSLERLRRRWDEDMNKGEFLDWLSDSQHLKDSALWSLYVSLLVRLYYSSGVSCRLVTAETQVQSQGSSYGICGWQTDNGAGFLASLWFLLLLSFHHCSAVSGDGTTDSLRKQYQQHKNKNIVNPVS